MKSGIVALQGTWNITALEVDGQPSAATGEIVVQGDRFTSLGMGFAYEGNLLIDGSKKPATIDMVFTAGPPKGKTNRGIFEFTGKDRWRLCLQMSGADRPKKFATVPGSGLALETLERSGKNVAPAKQAKAKTATLPRDFPSEPVRELEGEWQMIAMSHNGQPLEEMYCKMGKRVASGNELTVFMGPQTILKTFYAIDRSVKPNTMDYALSGKRQFGIFEYKGDSLTTCFSAPGKPRPTDFASTRGDGRTVTTWKKRI